MTIETKLNIFCMSSDFDECINILKKKLKKTSQMETYDCIYDSFIQNNVLAEWNADVIIPNLNIMVKLMVFSQVYRQKIFPGQFEDLEITDEQMNFFKFTLQTIDFSFNSFMHTSAKLCAIYDDDGYNIGIFDLPTKKFCFPYVLLHKAGNLSFESLSGMLFENETYSKLPVSFKFVNDNTGPHGGYFAHPFMFFDHDYDHMTMTIDNIKKYDISIITNLFKNSIKGTLKRRFIEMFANIVIFENIPLNRWTTKIVESMDDPFDFFDDFDDLLIKIFDKNDVDYVFKYLLESNDINEYSKDAVVRYIEYKNKYDKIKFLLKEIINDDMFLDMNRNETLDYHKYSESIDVNDTDDISSIMEKLNIVSDHTNKKFLEAYIKPLFRMTR